MIFFYHLQRISYDCKVSKSQKVHFEKPQFLYGCHRKLRGYAFFGKVQRYIFVDAFFGYNYSCRMSRCVSWHTLKGSGHIQHLCNGRVCFIHIFEVRVKLYRFVYGHFEVKRYCLCYGIGFSVADIKRSAHISDRRLGFHGSESYYLGNLVLSVFVNNIIYNLVPSLIAEVYINIRHAYSFGV